MLRSFRLNVLTEMMVNTIIKTAIKTTNQVRTLEMIFQAFFIGKHLPPHIAKIFCCGDFLKKGILPPYRV